MNIKTGVIETHLTMCDVGWGNGYVGVPKGHPWSGKDYDAIDCNIHGGLTYANDHFPKEEPDGFWWVGFDTAHLGDNKIVWPQSRVIEETERLKSLAEQAAKEVAV